DAGAGCARARGAGAPVASDHRDVAWHYDRLELPLLGLAAGRPWPCLPLWSLHPTYSRAPRFGRKLAEATRLARGVPGPTGARTAHRDRRRVRGVRSAIPGLLPSDEPGCAALHHGVHAAWVLSRPAC